MSRYYEIPKDTFEGLIGDTGLLLRNFDIETAAQNGLAKGYTNSDIITATTGGIKVELTPTFSDLGEDVDNCPPNMLELKHLDSYTAKISTTGLGLTAVNIRDMIGAADIEKDAATVTPRMNLLETDFRTIWWVTDKANGGFVAAKLTNGLSTSGLSLQTGKNTKGQTTLEFTGHVSLKAQNIVPLTFYSHDLAVFEDVTVTPAAPDTDMFGTLVDEMQSKVVVDGVHVSGLLHYLKEGALVDRWGAGHFLALQFGDFDKNATSIMVGMDPSMESGLVEIIDDPDKNGAFKVTNKNVQKFKIVTSDGTNSHTQYLELSGLSLEENEE